jgi:malate/lactate dehydrogenase
MNIYRYENYTVLSKTPLSYKRLAPVSQDDRPRAAFPAGKPEGKVRVHLLALGDVGSTLLLGLRLLGGGVISSIGIYDVRPETAQRWAFEMNQIRQPGDLNALPPVEVVETDELFDCDVFLFCASRMVPDTAVTTGDVRMAQYQVNRALVSDYAQRAKQRRFKGLFCVVSDPVDPLCRAVLAESGLEPYQVRGFGLGVMNARAAYFAQQDPRFASYLADGRVFGPHGEDLVVANSVTDYDDELSLDLTDKVTHANLELRQLGFKPYVAPAMSSGALSLLALLRGEWHYSSVYLDGIYFGLRNRLGERGLELEGLELPDALLQRIQTSMENLRAIQ